MSFVNELLQKIQIKKAELPKQEVKQPDLKKADEKPDDKNSETLKKTEGVQEPEANKEPVEKADGSDFSEAVVIGLNDGSIEPTVEAVSKYLVDNHQHSPEDAEEDAKMILDAYFSSEENEEKEEAEGQPEMKADPVAPENPDLNKDMTKSGMKVILNLQGRLNTITKNLEVIAKANSILLDKVEENNKQIKFLKSVIKQAGVTPANTKKPVMKSFQISNVKVDANKAYELIMKGVLAGKLGVEEVNYFETNKELSPSALKYIEGVK